MDTIYQEDQILNDIIDACVQRLGWHIQSISPIHRGWLNLKWKIHTDTETYLIKQYNCERFRDYDPAVLNRAFAQQIRLYHDGIPAPKLITDDHTIWHTSHLGERFLVMEYCEGDIVSPGTVNGDQLYDLGRLTGQMHLRLNDGSLPVSASPLFQPPTREQRLQHWDRLYAQLQAEEQQACLPLVEQQRQATVLMNTDILHHLRPGWAHRDLWTDNLLFYPDKVAAILDYDRLNYDYPQLDIARAILSCIWNGELDYSRASVFMQGYREVHPLYKEKLGVSLQALWYMESVWWIRSEMDVESGPPQRFALEMNWLAEHYGELEEITGSL
ncbi:phosphotransferase [Paenibacillus dauci]|uniref:phosphotransferase n=1 Tax=Paenibacillus dauci TaxID=1567106 RepID=UPI000619BD53|nr:phosphotransferase [Paenibacillus dauci]